jgi:hypothetical protein
MNVFNIQNNITVLPDLSTRRSVWTIWVKKESR